MKTYVILENIRSAHNVGSIFRTADGADVDQLFLVGYTPAPIDRFGREQPEIIKTSLGASGWLPWEAHADSVALIQELQQQGVSVVAVEQTQNAIPYRTHVPVTDTAYIFGNEVEGVSEAALAAVNTAVEIPMLGQKESLNVSVSAGIILFNTQPHQQSDPTHQSDE